MHQQPGSVGSHAHPLAASDSEPEDEKQAASIVDTDSNRNRNCNELLLLKYFEERPNYWQTSKWLPSASERRQFCHKLKTTSNYSEWDSSVQSLYDYVEYTGSIHQMFIRMCEKTALKYPNTPFTSNDEMCSKLNEIINLPPKYSSDKSDPLVGVPMAVLFADVATSEQGMAVMLNEGFNARLKEVMNKWKQFLDSGESFVADSNENGWIGEEAKREYGFEWYETSIVDAPYWNSWNDFFTRRYKEGKRINYGEGNEWAIQLTNDGTLFRYRVNIRMNDEFWLKDMPYSLHDIFGVKYKKYANIFCNGSIFQSYLNPFNYHCYHAPVTGKVCEVDVLEGAYFGQLVWQYGVCDPGAGTLSLPWLTEVNARGILIIETDNIGKVCVIAIGMGEVSSVNWSVKKDDQVTKGDMIGKFKFGGSSICILTEDMAKYGGELVYEDKFKPYINADTEPDDLDITFYVGELMATVKMVNKFKKVNKLKAKDR